MKKIKYLAIAVLAAASFNVCHAQITTHPNGKIEIPNVNLSDGPLGFGSLLWFSSGSNNTAIQENWGLNINGDPTRPVKIYNTSLLVGYSSSGQDYGSNNAMISGWLGVGTMTPKSSMHVLGNALSKNSIGQYNGNIIVQGNSGGRDNTAGATLEFVIPADVDGGNPWGQARIIAVAGNGNNHDATGKLILGTRRMFDKQVGTGMTWNYGDDIVIDGEGRIGMGTVSPDAKLAVKGNIHTQEVKVDMNGWPDYVFKPTYKLPSLNTVKAYIDKNKHLPDMPSEADVAKEGVNLGEMNKLLLKKVEEMTLYLIEQQKQLKKQQQQINDLYSTTKKRKSK